MVVKSGILVRVPSTELMWRGMHASDASSVDFYVRRFSKSVIATATCLAGWLAGWLSHSGIVSKRLNLSENFFDRLKAPSF